MPRSSVSRVLILVLRTSAQVVSGTRFAELESIVVITMILQRYKITVKEEPEFANETFEQRKDRVLKAKIGLTLT